jgi:hypothetical protein
MPFFTSRMPELTQPPCKHCGSKTDRPKLLDSGLTRYTCTVCGKYTTPGAKRGRPRINDGLSDQQRWNQNNAEKMAQILKDWRSQNRDRVNEGERKRRAKKKDQKSIDM